MAELRYRAGNIRNPEVHKIGIIALGSHLENHGPALPIDTDAKIGAHIAFQSALQSGAKFLGIMYPAHELDTIDHGVHVSLETLKEEVVKTLINAKKFLDVEKVIIVNSHGGNIPLMHELWDIEDRTDMYVVFNNKVISSEGPHGGSGELSMAKVLGIVNEEELKNQSDVNKYEEIGLYGFKQARHDDPNIEAGARDVEENGVYIDEQVTITTMDSWAESFSRYLGVPFYWHSVRHYFTTACSKSGLPDDVIQMLVGWNDISMVQLYKDISCDEQFEKYFGEEGIKTVEQKSLSDM